MTIISASFLPDRTAWYQKFGEHWLAARCLRPMVLAEYPAARDAYLAGLHLGMWFYICDRWGA